MLPRGRGSEHQVLRHEGVAHPWLVLVDVALSQDAGVLGRVTQVLLLVTRDLGQP